MGVYAVGSPMVLEDSTALGRGGCEKSYSQTADLFLWLVWNNEGLPEKRKDLLNQLFCQNVFEVGGSSHIICNKNSA